MIERRWKRPTAFAVLLTLFGVAVFVALGVWQLDRAAQKRRLFAAFAHASQAPTVDLRQAQSLAHEADRYPHVRVSGSYLGDRGYWLDEQSNHGRIGVHAVGVFAVDGQSDLLLVDRGWVAWNHALGTAPSVPPLPVGPTEVAGLYAPFPSGGLRLGGNALPKQSRWPKLTLFLDRDAIRADLGRPVAPRLLLQDADNASGMVREWTPQVMRPERHEAYAFTWFGFVAVTLAIFVIKHRTIVETGS
jgi:cytochrome oxidase assembly protein ShyY1